MAFFEKNTVNSGRQIEADIAKAICILGMVFVHCFEIINYGVETVGTAQYIVVTVLDCIFGAGTFMFCMGFGIAFSRRNTAEGMMKRGLQLFLFGYLLNVVRYSLIDLIFYILSGESELLILALKDIFELDIMQFAGLALMLFGLLRKIGLRDFGITAAALIMSVTGSFVRTYDFNNFALNQAVGLFIGTFNHGTATCACFPLFNWFIIVVTGYLFAKLFRRCVSKKKFYLVFSLPAAAIVTAYMLIAIPGRLGMMGDSILKYYHMTTFDAAICICGAVSVLGMYYALSHIMPEKLKGVITGISSNINRIYCIHWVLLYWTWFPIILITGQDSQSTLLIFAYGIVLFTVSVILAEIYVRLKKRKKQNKSQNTEIEE